MPVNRRSGDHYGPVSRPIGFRFRVHVRVRERVCACNRGHSFPHTRARAPITAGNRRRGYST